MESTEDVSAKAEQSMEEKMHAIRDHHNRVRALISEGKFAEASSVCDTALALDPSNADSLFFKALVLYRQGYYRQAEPLMIDAFAINSFSPEYYTLLSGIYQRKGELEEANCVADQGLALQPANVQVLQVKVLALIKLFRLQEAQSVMQKLQRIRQESALAGGGEQEAYSIVDDDDPELLFEQALTIDPFKTKPRMESLDTIKGQSGSFRFIRKALFAERNNTIIGLGILTGLIMAIAFFFRDNATYKAFSVLIAAILLAAMSQNGALSVSTNIPVLFPPAFRKFLQKRDIRMAVRGMISLVIIIAAFAAWHYLKSYVGLVITFIAAGYFTVLPDKFRDGRSLGSFSIPRPEPKRKKAGEGAQSSVTGVPLQDVPYHTLYHVLRKNFPGKNLFSKSSGKVMLYSLLFLVVYPLVFLVLRLSGVPAGYKVLMIPELAVLFFIQLPFVMTHILNLPVFFPAGARKFIPGQARRKAYLITGVEILFIGAFVAWLTLDNAHVLWASGVLFFMILRNIFVPRKTRDREAMDRKGEEATLPRQELIDYIQQHHPVFKKASADAMPQQTAVSAEGSAIQRSQ